MRPLLEAEHRGNVKEVVVMHPDRFSRFAIHLLEFIFCRKGTKLVVRRQGEDTAESTKQLAEDLMAITTDFLGNHHGKRPAEG